MTNFIQEAYRFLVGDALADLNKTKFGQYYENFLTPGRREERDSVLRIFEATANLGDTIKLLYFNEKAADGTEVDGFAYCLIYEMTNNGISKDENFSQAIQTTSSKEFQKGAWCVETARGQEFRDRVSYANFNFQNGRADEPQEP